MTLEEIMWREIQINQTPFFISPSQPLGCSRTVWTDTVCLNSCRTDSSDRTIPAALSLSLSCAGARGRAQTAWSYSPDQFASLWSESVLLTLLIRNFPVCFFLQAWWFRLTLSTWRQVDVVKMWNFFLAYTNNGTVYGSKENRRNDFPI